MNSTEAVVDRVAALSCQMLDASGRACEIWSARASRCSERQRSYCSLAFETAWALASDFSARTEANADNPTLSRLLMISHARLCLRAFRAPAHCDKRTRSVIREQRAVYLNAYKLIYCMLYAFVPCQKLATIEEEEQ